MTAGGPTGRATWVGGRPRRAAAVIGLALLLAACGDDGGNGDDGALTSDTLGSGTTTTPGLPPCREVQHTVVFSIFGAATEGDGGEAAAWIDDPFAEPVARPGAADVVRAYRELGYEILYITSHPADTRVGDRPLVDAVTVWLGVNDFPVDEARVWVPTGGDASVALIEELARLKVNGVTLGAGYAGDPDTVFPLVTGGIPRSRVFTVGDTAGDGPPTSLLGDDLQGHLADVRALDPVCE